MGEAEAEAVVVIVVGELVGLWANEVEFCDTGLGVEIVPTGLELNVLVDRAVPVPVGSADWVVSPLVGVLPPPVWEALSVDWVDRVGAEIVGIPWDASEVVLETGRIVVVVGSEESVVL